MKGITVQEIKDILAEKESLHLKYVKVSPEDFRFSVVDWPLQHSDLIAESEVAISAGFISIDKKGFFLLHPTGSVTLKLNPDSQDEALLQQLFKGVCHGFDSAKP